MEWYDSIGYILIPVLKYFAGQQPERHRQDRAERRERVHSVVDRTLEGFSGRRVRIAELRGFIAAGARTLETDSGIREAVALTRRRATRYHPLGADAARIIQLPDLVEFFRRINDPEFDRAPFSLGRFAGGSRSAEPTSTASRGR